MYWRNSSKKELVRTGSANGIGEQRHISVSFFAFFFVHFSFAVDRYHAVFDSY